MIRALFFFTLFLINVCSAGETFVSSIHKIDESSNRHEETLLFLTNGLVVKAPSRSYLKDLSTLSARYVFTIDEDRFVQSIQIVSDAPTPLVSDEFKDIMTDFEPTILVSENEANRLFKAFRQNAKSDSQCYNRSHVWSYEAWKNMGIASMKAFIFFTQRYIREYDFKWWFHNAPMVYLFKRGERKELMLDPEFANRPLEREDWTSLFMKRGIRCAEASKYTEYELGQEDQYCYVMTESMYFYQPIDLERRDKKAMVKTNWVDWEVKNAFLQGFGLDL